MVDIRDLDRAAMPRDAAKAADYYTKRGKLSSYEDVMRLEPHFLRANGFLPGEKYCCDRHYRYVMLNEDMTAYYCTPTYDKPLFRIRDCRSIQSVELLDNEAGSGALTGALLFGVVGAVVGSSNKKNILIVRLHTSDINEPIVDLHVLATPLARKDKDFARCFENANSIYGRLMAIAAQNTARSAKPQQQGAPGQADEIRRYKQLADDGIISQEEFEAKKKQILGL